MAWQLVAPRIIDSTKPKVHRAIKYKGQRCLFGGETKSSYVRTSTTRRGRWTARGLLPRPYTNSERHHPRYLSNISIQFQITPILFVGAQTSYAHEERGRRFPSGPVLMNVHGFGICLPSPPELLEVLRLRGPRNLRFVCTLAENSE